MRTLSRSNALLLVPLVFCGCSNLNTPRPGMSPNTRTVTSIGDRTLPVATGEPGATITASPEDTVRPLNNQERISGRVVDGNGDPVPRARVRVAISGNSRGRDISTVADGAGGFTLRGLRPGVSYVVIGESGDDTTLISGRAQARASDTNVKISLLPPDDGASRVPRPKRVSPVSDRLEEDGDDRNTDSERARGSYNSEDLDPSTPDADELPSARSGRRERSDDSELIDTTSSDSRWKGANSRGRDRSPSDDAPADRERNRLGVDPSLQDEGPDPLPPAIDPQASLEPRQQRGGRRSAQEEWITPGWDNGTDRSAAKPDPDLAQGWLVSNANPSSRVALANASRSAGADSPPDPPARGSTRRLAHAQAASDGPRPSRRSKTNWEDFDSEPTETTIRRTAAPAATSRRDSAGSASSRSAPSRVATPDDAAVARRVGRGTPASARDTVSFCRYDDRNRQLIDFQLPDLDGRPVRFQELDADLVLLDFWGTWCQPCRASIPRLIELQKLAELQNRTGMKRLQVIGIACEQGPVADRVKLVSKAIETYGINYQILMSGMDAETCPLQQALHIQAFPTIILVDRQGNILFTGQGATSANMARLDQILTEASKPSNSRPVR
jgi:thiol-disulfide isomerase/thioredoxin